MSAAGAADALLANDNDNPAAAPSTGTAFLKRLRMLLSLAHLFRRLVSRAHRTEGLGDEAPPRACGQSALWLGRLEAAPATILRLHSRTSASRWSARLIRLNSPNSQYQNAVR